ncbi:MULTISPECIES: hypothetical protein [Clostridium]|uniref:Uncharacterized protein n=2 Tax=Clostridium TaxID=1485 RepID=A0A170NMT4_9CLOT|nr:MULTISPECIES: hypothetical protein [Clostridium]OAA93213.1 hypothetical protein WX73_00165 [Clostridium coskatii]OBR95404.1 hypothetical protein CLCOS_17280 [Clostridium coskatii]QXE17941.1 hypothetical protein B5S50_03255 [Clostridium sp. 001]RMD03196.1 hypothetical protein D9O40_04290 [Clostridium autoethanogenum]
MKESVKDFLFNLIISVFIGLFVGMCQVTVINMNGVVASILIISCILGGVIGTISRLMFIYIFGIKQKDVKVAFIAVFTIIGAISCIPSLYYHLVYNEKIVTMTLVSILASAELLGMSFCYFSYKKYLNFNLKLINKKKQLRGNR